jgi:fimbrial chaperone protein
MYGIRATCRVAAILFSFFLAATAASAQGIGVTPTNVLLAPGQDAAALRVTNHGDRKISFQIRGYSWRQSGAEGEDVLDPTADLVSSPPIATIQPGATQVVRLVLRHSAGPAEKTYRIIFDQLPSANPSEEVHFLIRLSIPVFAQPEAKVAPLVHWRIINEAGQAWLSAVNQGNRHLTVHDMKIQDEAGNVLQLDIRSPPHILAGASRRWRIVTNAPLARDKAVRLTAGADLGTIDERIVPDAGP